MPTQPFNGFCLAISKTGQDISALHSGKYAPIPGQYSNDMRLLVDALLKKDPNARPCMDDVMGLVFVRTYLKAYASHACLTTARRRSSHARSLTPYRLWAVSGLQYMRDICRMHMNCTNMCLWQQMSMQIEDKIAGCMH